MENKIAFVTGSTSGIGLSTAKKLQIKGCKVIFSSEKDLTEEEISQLLGGNENSSYIKCDISNKTDITNTMDQIKEKYGRLDYLVCNAGVIPMPREIHDITDESIDKVVNTNLKGTFWTLKILGELIQNTSQNGSIVAMTSVDGLIGEPSTVFYSATKAGIISFTKSFARHYKNPLVRVNAVAPGLIETPLTTSTGEKPENTTELSIIERMGTSEEIADAVVYLLSNEASFITGQILAVDGGFTLK